jgi:hypothetical protein
MAEQSNRRGEIALRRRAGLRRMRHKTYFWGCIRLTAHLPFRSMRRGGVIFGLIALALALAASSALGAYKTSPNEGSKYAKLHRNAEAGPPSRWQFRNCWRIGPNGVKYPGGSFGSLVPAKDLRGGVACRFSSTFLPSTSEVCLQLDVAVKQKRGHFVTLTFSGSSQRWTGTWCGGEPGAEVPPPPNYTIGPDLFVDPIAGRATT